MREGGWPGSRQGLIEIHVKDLLYFKIRFAFEITLAAVHMDWRGTKGQQMAASRMAVGSGGLHQDRMEEEK